MDSEFSQVNKEPGFQTSFDQSENDDHIQIAADLSLDRVQILPVKIAKQAETDYEVSQPPQKVLHPLIMQASQSTL